MVVPIDEGLDIGFELPDGGMNTSPKLFSSKLSEPALDLVEPTRVGRREVQVIARMFGQPRFDLGVLVGGVIIHDDMDIEPARDVSVDLFEEVQELDRPVALVAFADDKP